MGTAGALTRIDDLTEPFLAMNGDVLTTLDYAQLMRFHQAHDAELTIATHRQNVDIDLGVIESEDGYVTEYVEKPTMRFDVSMGVYVYDPSVLELIPERRFDFPDVVNEMLKAGRRVAVYTSPGSGSTSAPSGSMSVPRRRSRPTRSCSRMPEWKVPLADVEISEAEIEAVSDTYRSGWLSMGPRTEELESQFASYVRSAHAIAVTNGTAALHLICLGQGSARETR